MCCNLRGTNVLWSKRYEFVMIQVVRTCRNWKGANMSWPKMCIQVCMHVTERLRTGYEQKDASGSWLKGCESVINVTKRVQIGRDQNDTNGHDRKVANGSWQKSANMTWPKGENGRDRKVPNGLWPKGSEWIVTGNMQTGRNQKGVKS